MLLAVARLGGVHLVDAQGVRKQRVLQSLPIPGDAGLEPQHRQPQLTPWEITHTVSLLLWFSMAHHTKYYDSNYILLLKVPVFLNETTKYCDHLPDEVSVYWGIYDGHMVLDGVNLPQGDDDGDVLQLPLLFCLYIYFIYFLL